MRSCLMLTQFHLSLISLSLCFKSWRVLSECSDPYRGEGEAWWGRILSSVMLFCSPLAHLPLSILIATSPLMKINENLTCADIIAVILLYCPNLFCSPCSCDNYWLPILVLVLHRSVWLFHIEAHGHLLRPHYVLYVWWYAHMGANQCALRCLMYNPSSGIVCLSPEITLLQSWSGSVDRGQAKVISVWQTEERQLRGYQCLCWFLPHIFNSSLCSLRSQGKANKLPWAAHVDNCSLLSWKQEGLDMGCRGHFCRKAKSSLSPIECYYATSPSVIIQWSVRLLTMKDNLPARIFA